MSKKLFLIGSPPACGKTYISRLLASHLPNPVYLDKDSLIRLSNQAYAAADEPCVRDTPFFKKYLRDAEYETIIDIGVECLEFNDCVIINAPFAKEFRNAEYMEILQRRISLFGAEIIPVWVKYDPELSKQRMIARDSDRDTWKLSHWDEYIATQNYDAPALKGIVVIDTTNEDDRNESLYKAFGINY